MPATLRVIDGKTIIKAGENTAAAERAATRAEMAAQTALALANFHPTKVEGEQNTAIGKHFAYSDGATSLIYATRVATGTGDAGGNSREFARGITQAYLEARFAAIAQIFVTTILRAGQLEIDEQMYLALNAGNPLLNFDANDFMGFRRGTDTMHVDIAGWTRFELATGPDALFSRSDGALRSHKLSNDTDSSGRRLWVAG